MIKMIKSFVICYLRPNGSGNDKMEEIINTNENHMNKKLSQEVNKM